MMTECDIVGETGLKFFGKISASVTHEIKNVLAIINENAGLMEDLAQLAEGGMPVDPERMKSLAQKVKHQIRRADGIVNNMNRFAHSADEAEQDVDLRDIIQLMLALSERLATVRGVRLAAEGNGNPLILRTNPFLLQNLIWLCLDFAIQDPDEAKTVVLIAEATDKGAQLRIGGIRALRNVPGDAFPGPSEKALIGALRAELSIDVGQKQIVMMLPRGR